MGFGIVCVSMIHLLGGRIVATPIDGELEAGRHEVVLETKDFNSGMYFARLQNGSIQQVRRMIK